MSTDEKSTYYDAGGIEVINIIHAKLTDEQYKGFLLGNVIKYACRMNYKLSPLRDAQKVAVYAEMMVELLDDGGKKPHEPKPVRHDPTAKYGPIIKQPGCCGGGGDE